MLIKVDFTIVLTGFTVFQGISVKQKKSEFFPHPNIKSELFFFFFNICVGKKDLLELRCYTPSSGQDLTKASINETPQWETELTVQNSNSKAETAGIGSEDDSSSKDSSAVLFSNTCIIRKILPF